jgi:hypothetical protein
MDLPGTGIALVPCIDMANHASRSRTNVNYEIDREGNSVIVLLPGQTPRKGKETVITYGDEKGECEMLFSYGFIDSRLTNARSIFLSLEIPYNDPLKPAKLHYSDVAPGFRIYESYNVSSLRPRGKWYGPFVWL